MFFALIPGERSETRDLAIKAQNRPAAALPGGKHDTIHPCVYILASRRNGTLYVGVARALLRRMWMHRTRPSGFCARYAVRVLVWCSPQFDMTAAIAVEKRLKRWRRLWKIELIESINPEWRDPYCDVRGEIDWSRLSAASPLRPG